ncbi:MAG: aromatic amino acid transport family protein [Candidatus Wildermuthbacteria bacterium]|nr:aromatic amino acid transport family protein [Candidatus Wildermuthbacteria bacterium]
MRNFVLAVSSMVGPIIGAGIFGIPFVVAKSGVIPGIFYFIILTFVVVLLHLFFGEICLRTEGKHRLVGYAQIYLGAWGRLFASLILLFVLVGTILAYLILAGDFLKITFSSVLPFSSLTYTLLFVALGTFFVARGRQLIAKAEFLLNIGIFAAIGVIAFFAAPAVRLENFALFDASYLFLPFGVIFFALIGWEAIPEVASFIKDTNSKVSLAKVIVVATLVAAAICFVFAALVVGVSGISTTEDAFAGLISFLGERVAALGALLGVFAIASSFLVIANYTKNALRHDFEVPTFLAIILTIGVPLFLFLIGFNQFIAVIGVVGIVSAATQGMLMIAILKKAKQVGRRVPEFSVPFSRPLIYFICFILLGGALADLLF